MSEHTPGPWEVIDMTHKGEGYKVQAPKAHYSRSNVAHFMTKEDATLIAAALEMLEALKVARDFLDVDSTAYETVDAAIAKAEGRTP